MYRSWLNLTVKSILKSSLDFWATVCKTARPILSVRCLPVCPVCPFLSVCNVGALWPNGWMDQDETWHAGRPRPRNMVLDGDGAPTPPKRHRPPIFSPCQLEGKEEYLYSAFLAKEVHSKRSGMDHTVLPANNTMPAFPS